MEVFRNKFCLVRTYSAGVFAGTVIKGSGKEFVVANARRLWYWSGAASLSELAVKGVANSKDCKFPIAVPEVYLSEVIEIIPCTEEARKSIEEVKVWTSH